MFRRRKPRVSEPANFKSKQGTPLDKKLKVNTDEDDLKEPKKLDEFRLAADKEELDERMQTQSEPRSPANSSKIGPPGKRPSNSIRRLPSSKNATPVTSRPSAASSTSRLKSSSSSSSSSSKLKSPSSRVNSGSSSKSTTPIRGRAGAVSPKKTSPSRPERTNSKLSGNKKIVGSTTLAQSKKKKTDNDSNDTQETKLSSSAVTIECDDKELSKASENGISVEEVVVDNSKEDEELGAEEEEEEEEEGATLSKERNEKPDGPETNTVEEGSTGDEVGEGGSAASASTVKPHIDSNPTDGDDSAVKQEVEEKTSNSDSDDAIGFDDTVAEDEEVDQRAAQDNNQSGEMGIAPTSQVEEDNDDDAIGFDDTMAGDGEEDQRAAQDNNQSGEKGIAPTSQVEEDNDDDAIGFDDTVAGDEEVDQRAAQDNNQSGETEIAEGGETADEIAEREMKLSESDPTHPPPRYIEGMHGDMPEATRRWANTLEWRSENKIDGILSEDMPMYPVIRKHYSHFFHGHGKTGSVVLYIRPGKSDFPQLWKEWIPNDNPRSAAKERLVVPDDLVRHHVFMLESLFQHWGPTVKGITGERATSAEMQRLIAVFDLQGFSFRSLRSFFGVFKKVVRILEQHCVGRADRIMVINAPNFRNVAYLVYPLVPKEVKAKIEICGRRYQERLRELLVESEIPREYGGDSDVPVGEWVLEKHINYMYNHPQRKFPDHEPFTGEIIENKDA